MTGGRPAPVDEAVLTDGARLGEEQRVIDVLRNGTYRALFLAQDIALIGTGLLTVALGLLAFDIAGDDAGSVLGTALTIKMVAYVGVAPLVAALVDRLPKKAVLVTADAVRLAVALVLPFVGDIWQIYVLVFVLQSASATFTPAFQSLIPSVLPDRDDYTKALALSRLAYDLDAILSPLLAAVLLTLINYNNLFLGTAVGFVISSALVLVARLPRRVADEDTSTFWQRLPTGLRVFAQTPSLRFLMTTNVVVAASTATVLVNSVVYTKGVFGLDDNALALTLGAYGLGSLLVALNIPRLVERIGVARTMLIGVWLLVVALTFAMAVAIYAVATGEGWGALLLAWFVLGSGTSLVNTPSSRLLAEASTPQNRNLVYTAQFALSHGCFLVTYPIAGWLGAAGLPLAAAALLTLGTVGAIFSTRRYRGDEIPTQGTLVSTPAGSK